MTRYIGRYSPQAYALLRIVAGLMFLMHGLQKLFGMFGGRQVASLASLQGVAGIIETVGGALVMIGLFGSIAAFICSGQMAVAYFMVHFKQSFWPLENRGELAALYCFVFLYVAATGSGIWSVDAMRGRAPSQRIAPKRVA
jgi:putative oxidoreductase